MRVQKLISLYAKGYKTPKLCNCTRIQQDKSINILSIHSMTKVTSIL